MSLEKNLLDLLPMLLPGENTVSYSVQAPSQVSKGIPIVPPTREVLENSKKPIFASDAAIKAYYERTLAIKEQVEREKALKEQELRMKEQALREQALREQALREQALREQALREQALREQALREQALREQALREQALREQALREQALREQALRDHALREQALREQALREQEHQAMLQREQEHQAMIQREQEHQAMLQREQEQEQERTTHRSWSSVASSYVRLTIPVPIPLESSCSSNDNDKEDPPPYSMQVCESYLKFGECAFEKRCQYRHPHLKICPADCTHREGDNTIYPVYTGRSICKQYREYGVCNKGELCEFSHPHCNIWCQPDCVHINYDEELSDGSKIIRVRAPTLKKETTHSQQKKDPQPSHSHSQVKSQPKKKVSKKIVLTDPVVGAWGTIASSPLASKVESTFSPQLEKMLTSLLDKIQMDGLDKHFRRVEKKGMCELWRNADKGLDVYTVYLQVAPEKLGNTWKDKLTIWNIIKDSQKNTRSVADSWVPPKIPCDLQASSKDNNVGWPRTYTEVSKNK